MRHALSFTLLALLASLHPTAAQDTPEVDPFSLYRVVGRSWTVRTITWQRGKPAVADYRRYEVTMAQEDIATVKNIIVDKDGFVSGGDQNKDLRLNAELKAAIMPPKGATETRLEVAGINFACTLAVQQSENLHSSVWRSAKFPALVLKERIVRQDSVEMRDVVAFNDGVPDPWTLYRIAGRRWTYRVNSELKSPTPKTGYEVYTVTESTAAGAKVVVTQLDKDKKEMADPLRVDLIDFEKSTPWKRPEVAKDRDVIEGTLDVANIKWASIEIRHQNYSEFMSKNWPGLLLKSTGENSETSLVEFCTGHDEHRLYRVKGNFSVQKQLMRFKGGLNQVAYNRSEVTDVNGNNATLKMTTYDQNMRENYSGSHSVTAAKFQPRPANGNEPIEERITVGAGTFSCLKTTNAARGNTITMWTHHGVHIRMLNESNGFSMLQEMIELKLS